VISDEIYADLIHTDTGFTSVAAIDPAHCVITGGLSKSLALGGWRIGVARVPRTPFGQALLDRTRAIASEIWSCIPGPTTAAARVAYNEPPEIVAHTHASRRLHAQVSQALYAAVQGTGAACREPMAAFYLYPDLGGLRDRLEASGIDGSSALARALLERHGIAVLPGEAFGDDPRALRFRMATSLLYGETEEQRWAAMDAAEAGRAAELPAVSHAVARLRVALGTLLSDARVG
jgi:aspartate aminotransferase